MTNAAETTVARARPVLDGRCPLGDAQCPLSPRRFNRSTQHLLIWLEEEVCDGGDNAAAEG
jgi:hypothetical protein